MIFQLRIETNCETFGMNLAFHAAKSAYYTSWLELDEEIHAQACMVKI